MLVVMICKLFFVPRVSQARKGGISLQYPHILGAVLLCRKENLNCLCSEDCSKLPKLSKVQL